MPSSHTVLRGITWNHTRGLLPLVATAQLFSEQHPEIEIAWEKRSLQAFADEPIEHLAEKFDLLVIDHPWAGYAAAKGILLPLDAHLPAAFLAGQAAGQVGRSHESYHFHGRQVALAIDAATPVASWRPDVLAEPPRTWEDTLGLARRGRVLMPGRPIDLLMNFYMMCGAAGEFPFTRKDTVVTRGIGHVALESLRELAALCHPAIYDLNPIGVYRRMSGGGSESYCPFAYGYSNYARRGYATHRLAFGDLPAYRGRPMASTLGGTGLAISTRSPRQEAAVRYARFVAEPEVQRTIYTVSGGQPGHRSAWVDEQNNAETGGYFAATLPALDRAYLRPRYDGYMHFQDHAGDPVRDYIQRGGNTDAVLARLDELYAESLMEARA